MALVLLIGAFETSLFPTACFLEPRFNPALLSYDRWQIAATAEERFGIPDLTTFASHLQTRNCALKLTRFGSDVYRENAIAFGYGFGVRGRIRAGIELSVLNCWVKDVSSRYALAIKCGSLFELPSGALAAWLNNLNLPRFGQGDRIPLSYCIGGSYDVNKTLSCRISVRGVEKQTPFLNTGIGISPVPALHVDLGINSEPLWFEYGCTVKLAALAVNYSGHNHQQLGLTHSVTVLFGSP